MQYTSQNLSGLYFFFFFGYGFYFFFFFCDFFFFLNMNRNIHSHVLYMYKFSSVMDVFFLPSLYISTSSHLVSAQHPLFHSFRQVQCGYLSGTNRQYMCRSCLHFFCQPPIRAVTHSPSGKDSLCSQQCQKSQFARLSMSFVYTQGGTLFTQREEL